MKYSKTLKIKNKRFKKDDILQIAKTVEDEFKDDDLKHVFTIDFWDDNSITSGSAIVFMDPFFNRKKTKRIYIEYYNSSSNKHIEITISDSIYDSKIKVTSEDQKWFNAIIGKFNDIFNDIEKQVFFAPVLQMQFTIPFQIILTILLSYKNIIWLSNILNNYAIILPEWLHYLTTALILGINLTLFLSVAKFLEKAFPYIEFCFGAEHMNQGEKYRKALLWIISAFLPTFIIYIIEKIF